MSELPAAAVAIIRVNDPEDSVLLLRRNRNPQDPWSGHFSFPGGRMEPADQSLFATCVRETFEETGILLTDNDLSAELPARYAGSRVNALILVQPFLFSLPTQPPLVLEEKEIANSCWLSVHSFLQQASHVEAEVLPNRFAPAFPIDDYYVWGFTYGLLSQVVDLQAQNV